MQADLEKRPAVAEVAEAGKKYQELLNRCNELERRPPVDAQTAEGQKAIQDLQNRCAELEKRPTDTQIAEAQNCMKDSTTR